MSFDYSKIPDFDDRKIPGKPKQEIKIKLGGDVYQVDLSDMSRDELISLKNQLDSELDDIKLQIKSAESRAAATGVYADRDWFYSAIAARKKKGRQVQRIQQELGKRKRERGESLRSPYEFFVDIARARIDDDLFEEMMTEAHDLYRNQ